MKHIYTLPAALILGLNLMAQNRVTDQLVDLYTFTEGSGAFVHDASGVGFPSVLVIEDESKVEWVANGGLHLTDATVVRSLYNAVDVFSATATNEITVECWLQPDMSSQTGPARILTVSHGVSERNVMIGQDGSKYGARLRTSNSGLNSSPFFSTSNGAANQNLQHVVFTHASNGSERLYINGVQVATGSRTGDFSNWTDNYRLALGNEIDADRPWLGTFYLAAVYTKALSQAEVQQNFNAGAFQNGSNPSSEVCAEPACYLDGYGSTFRSLWLPTLPNGVLENFEFDADGGHMEVFDDGTAHIYGNCVNMTDPTYGFYLDFWFKDRMNWSEWSALGRSWKGTSSIVGNLYTTWDYYIMDPDRTNVLIGTGAYDGSLLNVTHRPSDYTYGLQVGLAANDKNQEPGLSCWFDYTGVINGVSVANHGDINIEGGCEDLPVLNCAADVTLTCTPESLEPAITGVPDVYCNAYYELTYDDVYMSMDCPIVITRIWTATASDGTTATCEQTITINDTTAPIISAIPVVTADCDFVTNFDFSATDDCSEVSVIAEILNTSVASGCDAGQLRTQTQGGWGTNPNGNNPGVYLDANFANAFPNGLSIGCGENTLTLTTAQAVRDFLPSGGTPAPLSGALVNPGSSLSNTFAGQLVAATLSVTFDAYDPNFGASTWNLGDLFLLNGSLAGWTVNELITAANEAIGGCSNENISALNDALSMLNENYVDGTTNNGNFACSPVADCAVAFEVLITATDACGNQSTLTQTVYVTDNQAPVILNAPENITVSCGEIPEAIIEFEDGCFTQEVEVTVSDDQFSGACFPTIQRTFTLTDACGNQTTHVQYIAVVDTSAPVFVNVPQNETISCGQTAIMPDVTATDDCGQPTIAFNETVTTTNCGQVIERVWTAMDQCGNTASIEQIIQVVDNEGPVPAFVPANASVDCNNIPPVTELAFTDLCSDVVDVAFTEIQNGDGCNYEIVRTWVATDACGNNTIVNQVLQVSDTTPPVFGNVLSTLELACGEEEPAVQPVVEDDCSEVMISLSEEWISVPGFCSTLQRIWTASDACGNSSTISQLIHWVDNQGPVLSGVPASGSASCDVVNETPQVTAFDGCDGQVDVTMSESVLADGCSIEITRIWTATDACGNTTSVEQVLSASDSQMPVINGTSPLAIGCSELENLDLVTVDDDCLFGVELSFVDVLLGSDAANCQQSIQRTWTAADACGNITTFVQILNVVDDAAPVFTFVPENIEVPCGTEVPYEAAVAVDVCSSLNLEFTESWVPGACGSALERVWTATDLCGNTSQAVQIIAFTDVVAPILTGVPASVSLSCTEAIPAAPSVTASDNCDEAVMVVFNESMIPGNCPGDLQLVRTWTATDACGNQTIQSQIVSVSDTEAPVFDNLPADITADCGNLPAPAVMTASDNCSDVLISYSQQVGSGGCPNIFRTWVATDACGNSVSHTQTILVEDNEPPLLTGIPGNTQVDCNSIPDMPVPEVSDNCDDNVAVTVNENISGSGCLFTIIRTWIASDDCGNTTIVSQSIQVEDTEAPIFVNVPPTQVVECSQLNALPLPQVIDDCGNTVTILFEDQIAGSGCTYDILRTYTATDLCGHQAQASTIITVVDNTPPVISGVGPNTFVSCNAIPQPANAVAVDACSGNVPVTVSETQIGSGCSYIISRTYTAADLCGNGTSLTHLIYVQDSQAPFLLGVPDNAVIDCNAPIPAPANVGALDNCGPAPQVNFIEFTENNGCATVIYRTWTATDQCGNQATAQQTITVVDTTAPVFTYVPADAAVSCNDIPPVEMAMAMDNCTASPVITMIEELVTGGCPYEIHRIFIATDDCGNETTAVQVISVIDNEAPMLTIYPADEAVGCSELEEAPAVEAIDNCGTVEVILEETWGEPGCIQTLTRTWTATDACGNSVQHSQVITLTDQVAPILSVTPADVVVNCLEVPEMPFVTAYDDCSGAVIEAFETIETTACASEYTVTRNWLATDVCGNTTTHVQTISVVDDIAPILMNTPEDITVDCNNVPEVPVVVALESCGESPVVVFTETESSADVTNVCQVGNSVGYSNEIALWLNGNEVFSGNYVFGPEGGEFWYDETTGDAHLTGRVYHVNNANFSWMMDITLGEERTWDAWSEMGRDYKDDLGIATQEYQDWLFYILNAESSVLVGQGAFEGNILSLAHAPADFTYGFQLGMHASNHGPGYGLGGWFFYAGVFNGEDVEGHGDVFTSHNCCTTRDIIRTWVATDCAGNTTSWTQTIHVTNQPNVNPNLLIFPDEPMLFEVSGTEGEEFIITIEADYSGEASIELYDLRGQVVEVLPTLYVVEGATYTLRYPKHRLPAGGYVFTLSGGSKVLTDTEMVVH